MIALKVHFVERVLILRNISIGKVTLLCFKLFVPSNFVLIGDTKTDVRAVIFSTSMERCSYVKLAMLRCRLRWVHFRVKRVRSLMLSWESETDKLPSNIIGQHISEDIEPPILFYFIFKFSFPPPFVFLGIPMLLAPFLFPKIASAHSGEVEFESANDAIVLKGFLHTS